MTGPPPQPTLTDGDVVLRPWRDSDVDVARSQHDDVIAHRFGLPGAVPSHEQQAAAVARWREQYADSRTLVNFVVEHAGEVAGTVEVRQKGDRLGELTWALYPSYRGRGVAARAVRMLASYAFDQLGLERVEAYVSLDNSTSLRVASRAGLRREGVLRRRESIGGERRDHALFARLADDPEPHTHEGFIAMLNAGLPRKRVIAQGLIHDEDDRVLLCELTYKDEWDLPGGVVEPAESPAAGVVREVREELGIDVQVHGLRTVNWLPPWRAWDDACVFVFDLGPMPRAAVETMTLQRTEIVAVHWCDQETVRTRAAAATVALLEDLRTAPGAPYREGGTPPG